jgi:phosphate transport system permease protein
MTDTRQTPMQQTPMRAPATDGAGAMAAAAPPAAMEGDLSSSRHTTEAATVRLKRRYAAERRFKAYGIAAIGIAVAALMTLLVTIIGTGYTAFQQTYIKLEVTVDPEKIERPDIVTSDFAGMLRDSLRERFPDVRGRAELRQLFGLLSGGADLALRDRVLGDEQLIGQKLTMWVLASSDVDMFIKGALQRGADGGAGGRLSAQQVAWVDALAAQGNLEKQWNRRFFSAADSREPELVGVWGGIVGSFLTLVVCLALAFPLGVMAAIYLEEFAPKNRFTDLIEVNINNLAAVPSIIFGLLGLAVFLNVFGMPRSAPVVGGVVLALMSLPVIIIAGRAAIRSVPPSIREAAYGVGASKMQVVMHHVLPLAMPGMLTGTIIAMAQALGETAPLLMIGMVAFIVDIPSGFLSSATVLPVQIFMWADSPERGFVEKTSAAIMVLLAFLLAMNAIAIFLRKRFERRW